MLNVNCDSAWVPPGRSVGSVQSSFPAGGPSPATQAPSVQRGFPQAPGWQPLWEMNVSHRPTVSNDAITDRLKSNFIYTFSIKIEEA